jgi:hypothetical protein
MILSRVPFGKLPHIAQDGLVGPIRRYYGSRVQHFRGFLGKVRCQPESVVVHRVELHHDL